MKVIIAGSRTFTDRKKFDDVMRSLPFASKITEIVHGACRGVDSMAHDFWDGLVPVKPFPADWKAHGRAAGPIRNRAMAAYADALVALMVEGGSRGTQNMIDEMTKAGKPVAIYTV